MKCARVISLVLFWLSQAISVWAQTAYIDVDQERRAVAESFPDAFLRWDNGSGSLAMMAGLRVPGPFGTPVEVAEAFIHEYRVILGLPRNVRYVRHKDTPSGGRRIIFQLFKNGIPVPGTGILIGVSRDLPGERSYVDGGGNRAPPGFVYVTSSERRDYEEERDDWYVYSYSRATSNPARATLGPTGLLTAHGSPALTAGIAFSRSQEVDRRPSFINLGVGESDCLTDYIYEGSGRAFPTNPNLSDSAILPLRGLCNQSPYILDGAWLSVIPESGERTSSPAGLFEYDPSNPAFDEVSAYFHIENFLQMLFDRGFSPSPDEGWKILAKVQSSLGVSAAADYPTVTLYFSDPGHPYRNALHEAAVIAHETMHLVTHRWYSSSFLGVGNKEHWAMGEAYADYFGLVYRSRQLGHWEPWTNPVIGSYYVLTAMVDLPRDLSSADPHFSGYGTALYAGIGLENSLYDNSMIFSTALMDYDRLDRSIHSSSFVLESLSSLSDAPKSFLLGRDALIQVLNGCATVPFPDQEICCNSPICQEAAIEAFAGRGISTGADVAIAGEELAGGTEIRMIRAFPNPFRDEVRIEFEMREPSDVAVRVYDALGSLVETLMDTHVPGGILAVSWRPNGLSSGLYFVEIVTNGLVQRRALTLLN